MALFTCIIEILVMHCHNNYLLFKRVQCNSSGSTNATINESDTIPTIHIDHGNKGVFIHGVCGIIDVASGPVNCNILYYPSFR